MVIQTKKNFSICAHDCSLTLAFTGSQIYAHIRKMPCVSIKHIRRNTRQKSFTHLFSIKTRFTCCHMEHSFFHKDI